MANYPRTRDSLNLIEQAAPGTPGTGLEFYAKADKKLYTKDTVGLESPISGFGSDIQVFLAGTGTWTKPLGCVSVDVYALAGGGAGGSGCKGAASTHRSGGASGGSGSFARAVFKATDLPATVQVVVDATALGGASQTTNSTDGNVGAVGAHVRFGPSDAACYIRATGGGGGGGGSAAGAAAGAAGVGQTNGTAGRGPGATVGVVGGNTAYTASGGSGGSVTVSNVAWGGGNGAVPNTLYGRTAPTGGAIDTNGQAGTNPSSAVGSPFGGTAGAGGGGTLGSGSGGAGGAGGFGAGGGGGGGALDTTSVGSGAGGNGGAGVIVVISICGPLTGLASPRITLAATAPLNPITGDAWIDNS